MTSLIGQTVAHYHIMEKLGEGGMGVVYKAEDTRLKRAVALKFLPPELTSDNAARERFVNEAQAASSLQHQNICTIHDIDRTDDGTMFIVMDLYEGETLKEKIAQGPMRIEDALNVAFQVAQGLASAHARGIVHRDIKPANILLNTDGIARILDFGVAKLAGKTGLTKTGSTLGTFAYMSPEQVRGEEVDQRTDLWSVGVILYEMLAGTPPFRGEHGAALMYEILNGTPPPLRKYRPDIPDHVQMLVSKLLEKDPATRTSSAGILAGELKGPRVPAPGPAAERSIAVLYFENMSSERDTDYFCAGITEDIITDLSRITALKVVPRSDVLPFRNKDINTRQLGEALRASHVLEGSVRKAGNRIRITAQLTDVSTGYHVWAERFDRLLEDILDLQEEVARNIVEALRLSLTESEKAALATRPTDDLRAYDFYMRGQDLVSRRGRKNAEQAVQMLERALAIDPSFVRAHSALAEACAHIFAWYDGDPKWLSRIIEVSERALVLEPGSLQARLALGTVYVHQKRFDEAKRAFESVIRDRPDFYEASLWLGMVFHRTGEHDAAIRCFMRASELKPYSEEPWIHLDMSYRRKGDLASSEAANRRILETGSRRLALDPGDTITRSRVACAYARSGEREKALAEVREIREADPTDGHAHYNVACALAELGEKTEMLVCLRIAFAGGKVFHDWAHTDPDFHAYWADEDFRRLVQEFE